MARAVRNLVLRADIAHRSERFVSHTLELSETSAFVPTDRTAYMGDLVAIRLSFPGLVEPIDLDAQVVSHRLTRGPGDPGGWILGFVFRDDEERAVLRDLVRAAEIELTSEARRPLDVLLVEDNAFICEMFTFGVEKYFRGRGAEVTIHPVHSGEQAWTMLAHGCFDLAIVDYFLPDLSGDQLIARVRATPAMVSLPIIAVSVGGKQAREATITAGADLFLDKPLVIKDLFSTLDTLTTRAPA